ncbi:hypothetical protein WJX74_006954 [Apatococcus lobatus]|uniref:tRNA modification GTPase n=1 Tax=Apatococcus lobatus TaxID=904363 RepID=A0AAW1QBS9_9CHLO
MLCVLRRVVKSKAAGLATQATPTNSQSLSRDTICALSSAIGRASVAVIRISGPQANRVIRALLPPKQDLLPPRFATIASLYEPKTHQLLDQSLLLSFPGPRSFTGEDVVEVQCHGGPATTKILLDTLIGFPGVRLADAGEFTKRAFQAGKLDVSEVEGLSDLLAAETTAQHQQAIQQASGRQRDVFEAWQQALTSCLASVEAVIDFGEDEQLGDHVLANVRPRARALRAEIEAELANGNRGELVREGVRVAILGPPNAGKSTLLNALAGRDAAIVSSVAGTTRDTVQLSLDLGGHKVVLSDTAGLHVTEDLVEGLGIQRSLQAAKSAHLLVWLADASDTSTAEVLRRHQDLNKNQQPRYLLEQLLSATSAGGSPHMAALCSSLQDKPIIFVANKMDAIDGFSSKSASSSIPSEENLRGPAGFSSQPSPDIPSLNSLSDITHNPPADAEAAEYSQNGSNGMRPWAQPSSVNIVTVPDTFSQGSAGGLLGVDSGPDQINWISCHTGQGLLSLEQQLDMAVAHVIHGDAPSSPALPLLTRARHGQALRMCTAALARYDNVHSEPELAAEELRSAAMSLRPLTGGLNTEAVLDALFKEFCVGK